MRSLLKMEDAGPVCMGCADLDHLVFLAAGDTALTRRARQHSSLNAVVVRFSRARRRYERQGVLVEEMALTRAEAECLEDGERGSGRVGRSAAGRSLEDGAVMAAVIASVRHEDTPYDMLLMDGLVRDEARRAVAGAIDAVLAAWRA